jgi:thioredoxin reductase (NADPH)
VEASHGYLGRDPQVPRELIARGREELLAYPTATLLHDRVTARAGSGTGGSPSGGQRAAADGAPAGAGLRRARREAARPRHRGALRRLGVPLPLVRRVRGPRRERGGLGWSEQLAGFAGQLLGWARSVTLVTAGQRFEGDGASRALLAAHGVEVVEEEVESLVGRRGELRGVRLASGRELECELVFFSVAHVPRTDLAVDLGCELDDEGYVVVNDCGRTTVEGVYAAGDLVRGCSSRRWPLRRASWPGSGAHSRPR